MKKIWQAILFSLAIVVVSAVCFRLFLNKVEASDFVDQSFGPYTSTGYAHYWVQKFVPTQSNISSFKIRLTTPPPTFSQSSDAEVTLCGLTGSISSAQANSLCQGNDLLTDELHINITASTTYNGSDGFYYFTYTFHSPISLTIGATYYIGVTDASGNNLGFRFTTSGGNYTGGYNTYGINANLSFSEYYSDSFFPTTEPLQKVDVFEPNSELLSNNMALEFPTVTYCATTTAPCALTFRQNSYAVGKAFSLLRSDPLTNLPIDSAIASTTIVDTLDNRTTVYIPATTTPKQYFCGYLADTEFIQEPPTRMWCGFAVFIDLTPDYPVYDITSACNGVATSTGPYCLAGVCTISLDDLRYVTECGLRKVGYWAFQPSNNTRQGFRDDIDLGKSIFPLTIYYETKTLLDTMVDDQATTTTSTVSVDLVVPYVNGGQPIGHLLNGHIIKDNLGNVWLDINTKLSYFIYFLMFLYMITEIIGLTHKQQKDDH